ncbi:hypothetical protein QBC37DRAFT_169024 [Rhypophila decipiens]|uniref:Uncharacterized protein n=1 Tax=Rhypophila decipiens TaxID=261697 RepID=A0AAN6XS42_9PEZI|nr:hypothetical protein QBC37DRAFT_169024 [Rhypophila decipiens]
MVANGPAQIDNSTALTWACSTGNVSGLRALLATEQSPEMGFGKTDTMKLLYAAARSSRDASNAPLQVVSLLLEPKLMIDINMYSAAGTTAAMVAALRPQKGGVLRCLIRHGADVTNAKDHDDDTTLHYAIVNRSHPAILILLGLDDELGPTAGVEERYRHINRQRS